MALATPPRPRVNWHHEGHRPRPEPTGSRGLPAARPARRKAGPGLDFLCPVTGRLGGGGGAQRRRQEHAVPRHRGDPRARIRDDHGLRQRAGQPHLHRLRAPGEHRGLELSRHRVRRGHDGAHAEDRHVPPPAPLGPEPRLPVPRDGQHGGAGAAADRRALRGAEAAGVHRPRPRPGGGDRAHGRAAHRPGREEPERTSSPSCAASPSAA